MIIDGGKMVLIRNSTQLTVGVCEGLRMKWDMFHLKVIHYYLRFHFQVYASKGARIFKTIFLAKVQLLLLLKDYSRGFENVFHFTK